MLYRKGDVFLLKDSRLGYLNDRGDTAFTKLLLYVLETGGYVIVPVCDIDKLLGNKQITRCFTGPIGKSEEEKIRGCLLEHQKGLKDNEVKE